VPTGLNHITLAVSDLQASIDFYAGLLGMNLRAKWDAGAYLECGNLWLCLSLGDDFQRRNPCENDYTHYAFSIKEEEFDHFIARLEQLSIPSWKVNASEGRSHYFLDPDGYKLEVHVGTLASRLEACRKTPYEGMAFYD